MTKFASQVIMLVRRDVMRASKAMQQRVLDNPKITVMRNTELLEVEGDAIMKRAKIVNNQTQEESRIDAQ